MAVPIAGLENQYQYGLYGQGGNIPFGGITTGPKINPTTTVEPTTGITIPTQHSFVNDESGNKISLGQDGVGLAHRNSNEFNLHLIA